MPDRQSPSDGAGAVKAPSGNRPLTFAAIEAALAGRYSFERREDGSPPLLGSGGTAQVYLATDLRHHRPVALKVLQPVVAGIIGPERFLQEIRIAARLTHPNILPLLDAGSSDTPQGITLLWFAIPAVAGGTLRDRLEREGQLPIDVALRISQQIAGALACAHGQDLLHRDVKPENILLDGDQAFLADFGLAKALSQVSEEITSQGLAVGTPAYMSPEQGAGGQARIDARSDIYSLGCVLYEMLAGEPPFTGPTAQAVIARHQMEPPRSLRVIRATIPAGLEALVLHALEKVPADRFGSAAAFAAELGLPAEQWPVPKNGPAGRTRRRWIAGALAGAVTLAAGLSWLSARDRKPDPTRLVVFPVKVGAPADSGLGASITEAVLSALNSTSSIAGIDGRRLPATGPEEARAGRVSAGYYLTAALLASDSLRLHLELHSRIRDTILSRTLAFPTTANGWELGLHAARRVLALLFPAARGPDFPLLAAVAPEALAEFFQGEERYRQSAFQDALGHYLRAVEADSGFALAALHGAQAATWTSRPDRARALLAVALAKSSDMPPRLRVFAGALDAYLQGQADSAVAGLRRVLQGDDNDRDAWMLLGETYTHLLPVDAPLDSLAADAFEHTHRLDSTFTPVLFHQIEFAARRGDTAQAARALRALRRSRADSVELGSAELIIRCAARPLTPAEWQAAARQDPDQVRIAAQSLSVAGLHQHDCARAGWQALLDHDTRTPDAQSAARRYGSLVALQSILVAEGKDAEVRALWDGDTVFNRGYGAQVLVLDALATGRFRAHADSFTAARFAELAAGDTVVSRDLWLAASWTARRGGSLQEVHAAAESLAAWAAKGRDRLDALLARSLAAQETLARGDTAGAVAQLRALAPNAGETSRIAWVPWESLGYERLLLTELLVSRRRFPDALRIGAGFDAPAPLFYAIYLPASLSLRLRAAEAWDEQALMRRCRERLRAFGSGE